VDRCQGCLPRSEGIGCVAGGARYRDGSGGAVGAEGEDAMTIERAKLGQPVVDAGCLVQTMTPGHDDRQVEARIAELRARVCALEAELEDARGELLAAGDDPVATQAQGGLRHEWISQRMLQILQLAHEEAQQEREEAALHAAAVLERAQTEARELLEAAEATAEELLRAAMLRCEEELGAARGEASRLLGSARAQEGRLANLHHHGERPDWERASGVPGHLG
jgi:cell division septum initiation protein DivIVA